MGPGVPPLAVCPHDVGLEGILQTLVGDLYEIQSCKAVLACSRMYSHSPLLSGGAGKVST